MSTTSFTNFSSK